MKKIAIGSHNPIKIEATREAFSSLWPEERFEFVDVDASSGVSDQPMSNEECIKCIKGARNRAKDTLEKRKQITEWELKVEYVRLVIVILPVRGWL